MIYEINIEKWSYAELKEGLELLDLYLENKLSSTAREYFDDSEYPTIKYDTSRDWCWLENENGQQLVKVGDKLDLYFTTSWTEQQGTIDEHIENIPFGDYEEDDIDEVWRYVDSSGDDKLIRSFKFAYMQSKDLGVIPSTDKLVFTRDSESFRSYNRSTRGWKYLDSVKDTRGFYDLVKGYEDDSWFEDGKIVKDQNGNIVEVGPKNISFPGGEPEYFLVDLADINEDQYKAIIEDSPYNEKEIIRGIIKSGNLDFVDLIFPFESDY